MQDRHDVGLEMASFSADSECLGLWSLGQAGFVLKGSGSMVVVDPYLSDAVEENSRQPKGTWDRRFSPPLAPGEISGVDLVLVTHAHDDHCDRQSLLGILEGNPDAIVSGPYTVRQLLAEWGVGPERMIPLPLDGYRSVGDIGLLAVPAAHSHFDEDSSGEPAYVGWVLRMGKVHVYHAGDGVLYDGLASRLASEGIDVALLPVNGRDSVRERMGIVGNTDAREAFWLADQIGARVVVPIHNDLFAVNSVPWPGVWSTLEEHHPEMRCHRVWPGELLVVWPSDRTADSREHD